MELGIFSRTYEYSCPRESFGRMSRDGIYRCQLNLSNAGMATLPEKADEKKLSELESVLVHYNIKCDGLSGTFNMIDPDGDAAERGIRQFEHQCQIAAMLNIPLVSLCTGSKNTKSKWQWHDDNLKDSSWAELMRATERILRFAENSGIVLGVETEVNNIINTAERARQYLDEFKSPHLKIIMDGANLLTADSIGGMRSVLDEAFDALGEDIVSAHAKDLYPDASGKIGYTAPGKGLLDFEYYIAKLKNIGYKGSLTMHGFGESDVALSRDYLTKLI